MTKIGKRLKIGDVFEVKLENGTKGYLQYIADDMTQLNSRVVRVFEKRYKTEENPAIDEVISGETEFRSHVYDIKSAENDGSWKKVGNSQDVGDLKKLLFRDSYDMGVITASSENHVSKKWYVWRIGEETKNVGFNNKLLTKTDFGSVLPSSDIAVRMKTGKSGFFHPKYIGEN